MSDLQTKVDNAIVDMGTVEQFTSSDEFTDIISRLGRVYPSLAKAIRILMETGGWKAYQTEAILLATTPTVNPSVGYAFDTKKMYLWDGTSWVDEGLSQLDQANEFTKIFINSRIPLDAKDALERHEDVSGFLYAYTTKDGQLKLVGMDGSVQENINSLTASIETKLDDLTYLFEEKNGNLLGYFDKQSNLHIGGDTIYLGKRSILDVISERPKKLDRFATQVYQNALLKRYPERSEFTSVITRSESGGLRNRMIAAIKVPTGLFMVWHQQTKAEYDGDGSGSSFWCGFADIDSNFNITIRDKKLFIYPETDAGIIKHPHLGRTTDNRLILVYEKSVGYAEATPENPVNYIKYQRYSSDEGLTWTEPVLMSYNNSPPTSALKALGTTCEVLKLNTGRLIVALYSVEGHCGCIYSDNDGLTWTYSSKWIIESKWGTEPCISLDSNGNLVMSIRPKSSADMHAAFAKSIDYGETWQLIHTDRVTSVVNQSFLLYDDGLGLHMESHDVNGSNQRTNYRISLSYDDGNTFSLHYAPFPDSRYVGYTQLIKWVDGVYLLLMEYNDVWAGVNTNEDLGIQLLTISEILNNVTSS